MRIHRSIRIVRGALATIALAAVAACSPVYRFQTPAPDGLNADQRSMRAQMAVMLQAQGFQDMGAYYRASDGLGCGSTAPDRHTYEKSWRGETLWLPSWSTVWVQEFSCDDRWSAVILTDGADDEADALYALLEHVFADDIAEGRLKTERSHRVLLEQ
ncbi:MAG: hypothetical protein SF182_01270 [Deltaproteobacteria bacterium]|nr:hypothetical protein [Deltaproteobacteria bacterium]